MNYNSAALLLHSTRLRVNLIIKKEIKVVTYRDSKTQKPVHEIQN